MTEQHKQRFLGPWVGETQGCEMPAHLWSIRDQYGMSHVTIDTTWEGASGVGGLLALLRDFEGQPAFWLESYKPHATGLALLVDASHFVIPDWDTNDTRGHLGPSFDVIFSRPGVAELNARDVWRRFVKTTTYTAMVRHIRGLATATEVQKAERATLTT